MKWWYLLCGYTQEYALVYARNDQWEFEELKPDSYDGVLYFY